MDELRRRLGALAGIVALLFGGLFVRLGHLQIVETRKAVDEGERNRVREEVIPVNRGRILDRYGRVLVDNRLVSVVSIDRALLKARTDYTPVLSRLVPILGRPFYEMERRLLDPSASPLRPVEVARDVPESAVLYIGERSDRFPGVVIDQAWERAYPYGRLASHVLGYVRSSRTLAENPPCEDGNYTDRDQVGLAGVEKAYECELRGRPGRVQYLVDKRNHVQSEKVLAPPVNGADVRLTIDVEVQKLTEDSLSQALKAARGEVFADRPDEYLRACCGAAVVLDPADGAVLAMASYPDYEPSDWVGPITQDVYDLRYGPKNAEKNHSPLVNRAIEGQYLPGSTFKLVSSLAALRTGSITPNTAIDDEGTYRLADCPNTGVRCVYKNAGKVPHGTVDLASALTVSSDVYYYELADQRFHNGGHRFAVQQMARDMGLDDVSGVDLPNEKAPYVGDDDTRKSRGQRRFTTGDTLNTTIGQGDVLLSPLQLARVWATFANGGRVLVPHVAYTVTPSPATPTATQAGTDAARTAPGAPDPATPGGSTPGGSAAAPTAQGVTPSSTLPAAGSTSPGSASSVAASSVAGSSVAGSSVAGSSVAGSSVAASSVAASSADPNAPSAGPRLGAPEPGLVVSAGGPTASTIPAAVPSTLAPPLALKPDLVRTIDLPESTRQPVLRGLQGVVASERGTAFDAFSGFPLISFPIAGKTGTAQSTKPRQDNALFVGFGPVAAPRFVVAVVLEEGGFGGWTAAPAARRIFDGLNGNALHAVGVARARKD